MPSFDANDYVYLDWAATAPLCEEAALAMAPYQVPGREAPTERASAATRATLSSLPSM